MREIGISGPNGLQSSIYLTCKTQQASGLGICSEGPREDTGTVCHTVGDLAPPPAQLNLIEKLKQIKYLLLKTCPVLRAARFSGKLCGNWSRILGDKIVTLRNITLHYSPVQYITFHYITIGG